MDTKFFDLQRFAIYGTEGNDNLVNNADYRLIHGYGGDDTIDSTSFYAPTLYGDAGNDKVYDYSGDFAKLFGNTGNDSLYVGNSRYVTIDGGDGNDIFDLNGVDKMTVTGGKGDDTIYGDTLIGSTFGNGVVFKYSAGDGLDLIQNFKSTDTLSLTGVDRYELFHIGNDIIVNISDDEALTLGGAGRESDINISGGKATVIPKRGSNSQSGVSVIGSEGNDRLSNYGNRVTLYALGGNDSIYNDMGTQVSISAGDGNDSLFIDMSNGNTIDTGNGSDTIKLYNSDYASVNAGSSGDLISLNGGLHSTIDGGAGNDTIYGDTKVGHVYQYSSLGGNDLIYNFGAKDTLKVGDGLKYTRLDRRK